MWDFIYIDDVMSGVLSLIEHEGAGIYNIGGGNVVSLKTVVELINNHMGSKLDVQYGAIPYREGQLMHLEGSIEKIKNRTGWRPKIDLEEGLLRTIKGLA